MKLAESYWPATTSDVVRDSTVGSVLRDAAREVPDSLVLIEGVPDPAARRTWTYESLLSEAETAARALLERFEPGERVATWAQNIPEWIVLEFAAGLAGVVLVTVNPALRPAELEYVLEQSGASGIFLVPEFRSPMLSYLEEVRPSLKNLREVILFTQWQEFLSTAGSKSLPNVSPDDPVQIQYTSGTTGKPKGALLHHRGITNNARMYSSTWGLKRGSVLVSSMPLFHTAGCVLGVLGTVESRSTLVIPPAFEPGLSLELAASYKSEYLFGVPTMLIAMIEHPLFTTLDLSNVRYVLSGGTPVPPDLVRRFEKELEATFTIVFGTTECSPLLTQTRLDDSEEDRANTLGQPLPQTEVKVCDPTTYEPVEIGARGELCARGYLVMKGYWDKPKETSDAIDEDGWYHTGDLASMDERGYLRIEGRIKDMIIRGGENIYPREIEDVLFAHPHVADVAVVGVPDHKWGEVVAAFIRPAQNHALSKQDLFNHCREHLAPYKTPAHWIVVDPFPLTPSGKVQKFVLREQFVSGALKAL